MKYRTDHPANAPRGRRMRALLISAAWLTLSSLLARSVSLVFGTYLKERIGADGMGLFSLVSSVFSLALTASSSGIGLAASKMTAEALGAGSGRRVRDAIRACSLWALVSGGGAGALLFLFAERIGNGWLRDGRTVLSLRVMALTLPALAVSAAFSGYFSAMKRVRASAVTRVIEQGTRIGGTVLLLTLFPPAGLEAACLSVVVGGAAAQLLSCFLDLCVFLRDIRRVGKTGERGQAMTRAMFSVTLPIVISSTVRSSLTTLEHTLLPRCLERFGHSPTEALASLGRLNGMAMPLLFFPASLLYAFTGLLVPEFAERKERGEKKRITFLTGEMIRYTLCFGIGAATLLLSFSSEIGGLLYRSPEVGRYLSLLAPLVPVMYLDSAVDAILKGLGRQVWCMAVNIADAGMSVLLVLALVPEMGVEGYILVILIAEVFNASLSLFRLVRETSFGFSPLFGLLSPLASGFGAANLSRVSLFLLLPKTGEAWGTVLSMLVCLLSYLFFLFALGALGERDLSFLFGISRGRGADRTEVPRPALRSSPSSCIRGRRYGSDRPSP